MAEVERTVRYNVMIDVGSDGKGNLIFDDFPATDFASQMIKANKKGKGRVQRRGGNFVVGERLEVPKLPKGVPPAAAFALYKVSAMSLPMLYHEDTGEIRPLADVLDDDDLDIAEPTYFVYFEGGVVGYVFNQVGPRPRDLELYIDHISGYQVELRPIPRTDVLEAINQAGEAKLIRLKVPSEYASEFDGTSLSGIGDLVGAIGGSDIEILIRARGVTKKQQLATKARDLAPNLLQKRPWLKQFKVLLDANDDYKGDHELDLLEDYLVIEKGIEVVTGRRYLLPEDAVKNVIGAYVELKGAIENGRLINQ